MNPEEAQDQTEKRWLDFVAYGNTTIVCGWCAFADNDCDFCPIKMVSGRPCIEIQEYHDYRYGFLDRTELARKVYDLLVAHRQQLIEAGKELLRGSSKGVE